MNSISKKVYDYFKWSIVELLMAVVGIFLFCFAINRFITPNSLYNGGVLGVSQLLGKLVVRFHKFNFNIVGLINFLINVPLFVIAYKNISKTFFRRTIICVIFQTLFLTFIPIPNKTVVEELITSVLIGGVLAGIGSGLVLSANASMGGSDIIGVALSTKSRRLTVGEFGVIMNVIIFSICGLLYGTKIMIYSIIFTVFASIMVDKCHLQNINSTVMIFTKNDPKKIIDFVMKDLDRDVTTWEATGAHDESKTYISYVALSKYELERLERHIPELDKSAFLVKDDNVSVYGNYKKKLTK